LILILHELDEAEASVYVKEPLEDEDYTSQGPGVGVQEIDGFKGMKTQAQEEYLTPDLVPHHKREGDEDGEDVSYELVREEGKEIMWLGLEVENSVEKKGIDEDVDDGRQRDQRESDNLVDSSSKAFIHIVQEGFSLFFICNLHDMTFQTGH